MKCGCVRWPPNTRVQRTRVARCPRPGSPLTRPPLGRPNLLVCRRARVASSVAVLAWLFATVAGGSSGTNVGALGNVDDLAVSPVLLGDPLGLEGEKWRRLFADDPKGAEALKLGLATEIAKRLEAAGLKVDDHSVNGILVSIYGGTRLGGGCILNTFIVQVWIAEGERSTLARAILSEASNDQLSDTVRGAVLEIVDELIEQRSRGRQPLKSRP